MFCHVCASVAILNAVFCIICSLLELWMLVATILWNLTQVWVLYGFIESIAHFCFPHVVEVSGRNICIVLLRFYVCEFGIEVSLSILGF